MSSFRASRTSCLFLAALAFLLSVLGCGQQEKDTSSASAPPPYPPQLSSASSPREVAAALIRALDEGDKETLKGLVAVKSEAAALDQIWRGHGRRHRTTAEEAASLAAAGWGATYAFFQEGGTQVMDERVDGDAAVVRALGRAATTGKPRLLIISLLREDGLWKVQAGLQSTEP